MKLEFRLLTADDVEVRIAQCSQYGVGLLLYKNARVDQNILDEVVGAMNWQRHHTRDNANCIVSIWDNEKKQWIEKEDTGTESNTEAEKGLASDSFKRACFNWGIGRELYTAPNMFVFAKDLKTLEATEWQGKKKWTCKDSFKVTEIEYTEKRIVYVKVLNLKTNQYIEFGTPAKEKEKEQKIEKQTISNVKVNALLERCNNDGVRVEKILELYKVKKLCELNEKQYANINAFWGKIKVSN
jgi:hypothetical protein